jgi:hypothetical protein
MKKAVHIAMFSFIGLLACEDEGIKYPDFGPLRYSFMADSLYPSMVHDSLKALISYSACGGNKPLEIQYRVLDANECTVWPHYPGNSWEPCSAYFTQFVAMKMPERALQSPKILLLAPYGGPYVLK